MPVEIRELVIRATVEADPQAGAPSRTPTATARAPGAEGSERARLVAECVEQVMETLRERSER